MPEGCCETSSTCKYMILIARAVGFMCSRAKEQKIVMCHYPRPCSMI